MLITLMSRRIADFAASPLMAFLRRARRRTRLAASRFAAGQSAIDAFLNKLHRFMSFQPMID